MNYAGLEALAGKGGTLPAKASTPIPVISRSFVGAWEREKGHGNF